MVGRIVAALFVFVFVVVILHMDALPTTGSVLAADGQVWQVPDTFASMDHPFHVSRAETLRQSLAHGEMPQWFADHQGGYPVEFYPLGVPWMEVGLWTLALGMWPMAAIHKLFVTLVFLAPAGLFYLMARQDGRPLVMAWMAFALLVLLPGQQLQGGYTELVYMGLISNVAASIAACVVLPLLSSFVSGGSWRVAGAAALAAGLALYTNPRSALALLVIGIAVVLVHGRQPSTRSGVALGHVFTRLGAVAGLSALIAAPELLSLARFSDLYYFVRYSTYESLPDFIRASTQAVSLPVLVLALGGAAASWRLPGLPVARTAALALIAYVAITLGVNSAEGSTLLPQLEATRLMPFQRLLTIYLGAFMLHALLVRFDVGGRVRVPPHAGVVGATAVLAIAVLWPALLIPVYHRSLWPVESTAQPAMVDFADAVTRARATAPTGTAVLVIGTEISQHQQLWAPSIAAGPFFYDDWMWYWHASHAGVYEPCCESAYATRGSALQRGYLQRHAVGAIAVAGDARPVAAASPELEWRHTGPFDTYDVFAVRQPTTIVTWPGAGVIDMVVDRERLQARGAGAGGPASIRHNWHPRWQATVNGEAATVARTGDGYMSVPVPAGSVELALSYRRDAVDWIGLGAAGAGWLLAFGLCAIGRKDSAAGDRA